MNEAEVLNYIKEMWPGPETRTLRWLFPFGESMHFIGICMLFGSLTVIDLRLMGFLRQMPVKAVLPLIPFALLGFAICAGTGWLFVTSNPGVYWSNWAFVAKMTIILLAGLNALVFTFWEHAKVAAIGANEDVPGAVRFFGGASLVMWTCVLLLGRWLPLFTVGTN